MNRKPIKTQTKKWKVQVELLNPEGVVFKKEIEEGKTVKDLLKEAAKTHGEFVKAGFDPEKLKLTGDMVVVLNDKLLDTLDTKINDGDVVTLVPILAGG
jgi:molybdopterin converting factor small subunit